MIRVLIADEHELVRLGFCTLVESRPGIELIGHTDSFEDLKSQAQKLQPDVILLDFNLIEGNIVNRIPDLLAVCPNGKILVFTAIEDSELHLLALRLGALGIFAKKKLSAETLIKAITCVYGGEVWVNRSTTALLLQNFNEITVSEYSDTKAAGTLTATKSDKLNALTKREADVACLAAQGMSAKNIAKKLFISEKTVRNQLTAIYNKLGVASQLELALQASSLGIAIDQPGL
ncbi:hypothetical protein VZ94_15310 [Methylocucumis oryzae]|uniref:LuxR family transcriptional regulator n=1 Tax=Methylocucumis oryzae TaxID=1632867 RepID=A0A0F3IGA6_9GAMM|nr:hypothetical protein VZ94_15310 [Methylocucumis oryzae]